MQAVNPYRIQLSKKFNLILRMKTGPILIPLSSCPFCIGTSVLLSFQEVVTHLNSKLFYKMDTVVYKMGNTSWADGNLLFCYIIFEDSFNDPGIFRILCYSTACPISLVLFLHSALL